MQKIVTSAIDKLPSVIAAETMAINLQLDAKNLDLTNNIEILKLREKEVASVIPSTVKKGAGFNISENWNLPVTLIVFLENVSKSKLYNSNTLFII